MTETEGRSEVPGSGSDGAPTPLAVLLVEDNPADAYLVRAMLAEKASAGVACVVSHVERLAAALAQLEARAFDVVLLDLSLPDAHGLEIVTQVHAAAPRVPIVIMSGNDDEALALQGVRAGAQDYLVKGQVEPGLLVRALRYAIERQRIEDRLSAKTREQDAFIYTVSHDLRAPLVSLQGLATLLLEDYGPTLAPGAVQYVERISANTARMAALIADLLELSRVGRDAATAETTVVDLAAVVADVTEGLNSLLVARGATVQVVTPLPMVRANQTRLMQLVQNLVANAIYYTPAARTPLVRVAALARPDVWEVTVQDNGCGILPEYRDKVFALFQRLPDGRALHPAGTGVGLAIVARIVETWGGRIWIGASGSAGTTVHVTLPRSYALDPDDAPHP